MHPSQSTRPKKLLSVLATTVVGPMMSDRREKKATSPEKKKFLPEVLPFQRRPDQLSASDIGP